jgi:myo-inositol 2-dehydrogenase / D-chiro-inositol 1-dehydrogenase
VPDHHTSDMIINDSTVQDIDVARFMFDDEVAAVKRVGIGVAGTGRMGAWVLVDRMPVEG